MLILPTTNAAPASSISAAAPPSPMPPPSTHTRPSDMCIRVRRNGGLCRWAPISGKFENMGEYHAVEGDVLYAAPMSWHQMAAEAPSGPSVRLAMGGYQLINMNNTENPVNAGNQ